MEDSLIFFLQKERRPQWKTILVGIDQLDSEFGTCQPQLVILFITFITKKILTRMFEAVFRFQKYKSFLIYKIICIVFHCKIKSQDCA